MDEKVIKEAASDIIDAISKVVKEALNDLIESDDKKESED